MKIVLIGAGSASFGRGAIADVFACEELRQFDLILSLVDIDPDTLNLKSKGNWVTAYIELPEGYDVTDIDVDTVVLEGSIPAASHPTNVGDHDHDGVPDLMVKFSRQDLIAYLKASGLTSGNVELAVTGYVDGVPFQGTDSIRVK